MSKSDLYSRGVWLAAPVAPGSAGLICFESGAGARVVLCMVEVGGTAVNLFVRGLVRVYDSGCVQQTAVCCTAILKGGSKKQQQQRERCAKVVVGGSMHRLATPMRACKPCII